MRMASPPRPCRFCGSAIPMRGRTTRSARRSTSTCSRTGCFSTRVTCGSSPRPTRTPRSTEPWTCATTRSPRSCASWGEHRARPFRRAIARSAVVRPPGVRHGLKQSYAIVRTVCLTAVRDLQIAHRDMAQSPETVICLSHLRWNFVYQRPQHLLSRCARAQRVVFFEEPVFDASKPELELRDEAGVTVAVPHLVAGAAQDDAELAQRKMIDRVLFGLDNPRPVLWYLTPMAI